MHKPLPCISCRLPAVIAYPCDPFQTCNFGPIATPVIPFCADCNRLMNAGRIHEVAEKHFTWQMAEHNAKTNGSLRQPLLIVEAYRHDIQHFFHELDLARKDRMN